MHEVIDQFQWRGLGGVNGCRFGDLVVFDHNDIAQIKGANARLSLEPERVSRYRRGRHLDLFAIQIKSERLELLGLVLKMCCADETDIRKRKHGAIGAALCRHRSSTIVNAPRCPLRDLSHQHRHLTA